MGERIRMQRITKQQFMVNASKADRMRDLNVNEGYKIEHFGHSGRCSESSTWHIIAKAVGMKIKTRHEADFLLVLRIA
jgi:hypothetical protein